MSDACEFADDARRRIVGLRPGFEDCDGVRSALIRDLILMHVGMKYTCERFRTLVGIPRKLIRFWHDHSEMPEDVAACMISWERLVEQGFDILTFDDVSADLYIRAHFGAREAAAFNICEHPAMRCDYLRLCVLFTEGGFYVDCDDVLLNDGWVRLFNDNKLKIQPLCYDVSAGRMMPNADIWRTDLLSGNYIFYVNNNPIVAPAGHPVVRDALGRATERLLAGSDRPEIQATTGPGNLTTVLAKHAHAVILGGGPFDFELIRDWDAIAEMRWDLSYRRDERNWRIVYGC